jgi:hypothetical protein
MDVAFRLPGDDHEDPHTSFEVYREFKHRFLLLRTLAAHAEEPGSAVPPFDLHRTSHRTCPARRSGVPRGSGRAPVHVPDHSNSELRPPLVARRHGDERKALFSAGTDPRNYDRITWMI